MKKFARDGENESAQRSMARIMLALVSIAKRALLKYKNILIISFIKRTCPKTSCDEVKVRIRAEQVPGEVQHTRQEAVKEQHDNVDNANVQEKFIAGMFSMLVNCANTRQIQSLQMGN